MKFEAFQKLPRLSRNMVITEKIDGTNAQVFIGPRDALSDAERPFVLASDADGLALIAGSRSRYLDATSKGDNFGFAKWCMEHADELFKLGQGRHYGEWWGSGIQRGYGLVNGEKRFSLFNSHRWADAATRPSCCSVVPILGQFTFDTTYIDNILHGLAVNGSAAAPGFMNPEGIVVFHTASGQLFKKTIDKDSEPKSKHTS